FFARTEWSQYVGQSKRRRVAVAAKLQPLGEALAQRRQIVERFGNDAHPLQLALVAHSLHHANIGRNQLVLAQKASRSIERFVVHQYLDASLSVIERDERHL